MINDNVQILMEGKQVNPYIERVQIFADSNKKALGFLPKSVFRDQANNNRLWVAINADSGELLGYLLWGGRYPMLKVFHLYVAQQNRKQGIGAKLLSSLEAFGEKNNYLTISARVAADLTANKFWDRSGFSIISQEAGGQTSKRTINIRYKELDTPSLLKMMSYEMVTPGKDLQSLKLRPRPILSKQTYVLDLNVFFDVVKKRLHRIAASRIIASGLNHEIRVYVTPEFTAELNKHRKTDNSDPILEFAQQLPTLPEINQNEVDRLIKRLKAIVFPDQLNAEVPGSRSRSDLAHLAYCIHHRVTGFITRDKAILSANAQLQEEYLLEVLSAADLMQSGKRTKEDQGRLSANLDNENFSIGPAKENQRDEIEQFLVSLGVNIDNLRVIWHPGMSSARRRRIIARIGDRLIAAASWENPETFGRHRVLHIYVDERSPQAEMVIDHVFEEALRDSNPFTAQIVSLNTGPEQLKTQSTALKRGFLSPSSKEGRSTRRPLSKFAFRGLISAKNWYTFRNDFRELTDLRLPEKIPNNLEFMNTGIVIRNHKGTPVCSLNLFDFEILVSPGIVLCQGREGLLVPIQRRFAKNLFVLPHTQFSLFDSPEALFHIEKAYFRRPRNTAAFSRGKLVLFYLSGAGGGVVGCARITYSEVLSVNEVGIALARQGVLSREILEDIADKKGRIHAFTFDNFNMFPKRILFETLKTKNMISGANLVTAEQLSAKNLVHACEIGFCMQGEIYA